MPLPMNDPQPVRQVTPVLLTGKILGQPIEKLGFFKADGTPFDPSTALTVAPTVETLLMTGYVVGAAGAVAATDTLMQTIVKLTARIAALEAA